MALRYLSPFGGEKCPSVNLTLHQKTWERGGIVTYPLNLGLDVSGQLHVPAALSPRKEMPVLIG
jgi:hypothetical protein